MLTFSSWLTTQRKQMHHPSVTKPQWAYTVLPTWAAHTNNKMKLIENKHSHLRVPLVSFSLHSHSLWFNLVEIPILLHVRSQTQNFKVSFSPHCLLELKQLQFQVYDWVISNHSFKPPTRAQSYKDVITGLKTLCWAEVGPDDLQKSLPT